MQANQKRRPGRIKIDIKEANWTEAHHRPNNKQAQPSIGRDVDGPDACGCITIRNIMDSRERKQETMRRRALYGPTGFDSLMKTSIATLTTLLLISPASLVPGDGLLKVSAAPTDTNSMQQKRSLALPIKRVAIAQAPPPGAQIANAIRFNTSLQWKSNPKTRTVFAIDSNQRIWFIDPTSGWPYTLDSQGVVYTANALNGIVYSLGLLRRWQGNIPYFFQNWSYVGGIYVVPSIAFYSAIYWNPTYASTSYYESYAEVWQYENYFDSPEFRSADIDVINNIDTSDITKPSSDDALNRKLDASNEEANSNKPIDDNKPLDSPNGVGEQKDGNSTSPSVNNDTILEPTSGGFVNGSLDDGSGAGGFGGGGFGGSWFDGASGGGGFDGGFGGSSGGGDGGGL